MTTTQILIVAIGAVCVFAAVAAFTIAYRRGAGEEEPRGWREKIPKRVLGADLSEVTAPVLEPPAGEAPAPEAPAAEPAAVAEAPPEAATVAVAEVQRVEEISPEEAGVTRRQFFNRALLSTWGGFLGLLGLSMLSFFWPKLSGGFGGKIDAGSVEDIKAQLFLPDGTVQPLFIPDARAYIVPFEGTVGPQFEGRGVVAEGLTALWQKCVHLGCRVPWCSSSQGFECPCHGSKYNYVGEYRAGPAPRNLDRFVVEVNDAGRFIIDTGSVIQTARATTPSVPYPQGPSCIAIGG